jgi:hypothetical protein
MKICYLILEEALGCVVRYTNTRGEAFETRLWQILLHVVNHGIQSRSEVAIYRLTSRRER